MILILTGPAWSGSGEQPAKQPVDPQAEVDVIEVDPATLDSLGAAEVSDAVASKALAVVGNSPRCAALENSPLAEPDWYLHECLGGVRPQSEAPAQDPSFVPGDLFYLHNIRGAGTFPMSVYTSPIPTYTFTLLGANIRPIFAMDFNNTATTLHAIANGSTLPPISAREYGTYDLATGAFVAAGVPTGIPAAETISGLKFDPTSSTVYVNSTINLYTFDVTTGVATLVGPFTHAAAAVIEIAISNTGQMYGEDLNDNFYSINKATGATTLIGPMGVAINFAQGMDFDNSDNTLYAFSYIGGGVNDLRRINLATGQAVLILNGPAGPEHEGSIRVAAAPPAPPVTFHDEVEPNDTTATAQPLPLTPIRVRGNLHRAPFVVGNTDVDIYSFTAAAGARLYAATMTSWSSGSQDTVIDILDVDGVTILETDNNDGTFGGTSSNVGGTLLATGGTYFVVVRQNSVTALSSTVRPYDLYVSVELGTPTAEVEPNNNGGTPNPLPASGWVSGVIDVLGDSDTFSLTANAGDTIVVIQDLDPERDAPEWNGRTGIGIFNNNFLITGDAGTGDANPSEAIFMTARTTGTYVIYVDSQVVGLFGPGFTYNLSVFVIPAKVRSCTTYAGTPGAITDLGTTDFTIAVPDVRTVDYLKVALNATHTATADLDITLISPEGNEVILIDDVATGTGAAPQINTTLEDEAGVPMNLFSIHSGMGYTPEIGGRLEFFRGMPAQGTWTLRVRDDLTANTGTINSWDITVCEAPPRPVCADPGPQENTVFTTDFEAGDAGFTHSGVLDEWERGLPTFPPITTAHSGTNAWKTDLDSTYEISANFNLLSPNIDLSAVTGRITLNWWQKFQMESASFDSYWVEVRQVGLPATARRLYFWRGSTMNGRTLGNPTVNIQQAAGWSLVQADISDFAGRNVEVVFHIDTDTSVVLTGVAIDDVAVTACTVVVGQTISNVGITKTDGQTTYFPGEVLTYTIVASNAGPSAVVGATVRDNFPADLTGVSWTCIASAGSSCGGASGTGDINATVGLLPLGTATFTVTTTVSLGATGPISNTATITPPPTTADPVPANNTATDVDTFAAQSAAPEALTVDSGGNNVYQPNETVVVAPTWRNTGAGILALTGALANHTGPAGATYTIPDGVASYGTIAAGGTGSCATGGNCYSVANTTAARPLTHWDSTAVETVTPTGATKTWTLHIGDSFTDVPPSNGFYRFIETILHKGVTGGCTATTYCPTNSTTREQMAVFVLVSKEPAGYVPVACGATPAFPDVPVTSGFCRWVEELARRGVVSGCGGGNYCPSAPATREQMAVFVLRTLDPAINPPACVPPNLFLDVPETSGFCRWIEELANRGVVTGCGGGNYCPTADVSREQMGVFLAVTFGLTLYGL